MAKSPQSWDSFCADRNAEFEKMMDDIYYHDHVHPTNIPHYPNAKGDGSGAYNNANGGRNNLINGIERGRSMESSDDNSPQSLGGGQLNWGCVVAVMIILAAVLIALPIVSNIAGW